MSYQTVLLIISTTMVIVLTALLIVRSVRERKGQATLKQMNLADFSEFLRCNSVDGTIQIVAGRVSEYLKNAFGCEKIAFLRKQRGHLELNYYHGIRGFNRSEFRVRFSKQLLSRLQRSAFPREVEEIRDLLSESCLAKLKQNQMDTFFPVFWRDNLYGIYFVKCSLDKEEASFNLLISGLAHSLAAAYHIKWHESRYERLQQRSLSLSTRSTTQKTEVRPAKQIVKLVRHRNSESIVPRIAESVRANLGLDRAALFYEPKQIGGPLVMWKGGINGSMEPPGRTEFDRIVKHLGQAEYKPVETLGEGVTGDQNLMLQLKEADLKYVTRLPLTSRRTALLAWGGGSPKAVAGDITDIRSQFRDLVENAESYEKVEEMSYTDNLTGLYNQRYFHKRLREEIDRAKRYRRSVALIIFDMDDLKTVNDKHGHLAGDAVLKRLGQILRSSIRAIDIIARYGGDEFCVIMPEADETICERFMKRLQEKISSSRFVVDEIDQELHRTISQGGAVFPGHGDTYEALMKAADSALLTAKENGRNRYLLYSVDNESPRV